MSLPPPTWSALWEDIVTHHPTVRWPVADEAELERLADEWKRLGHRYHGAYHSFAKHEWDPDHTVTERDFREAWTGKAGEEYQRQVELAREDSRQTGDMALAMGDLVRAFHFSVGRYQHEIWNLMEKHEDGYLDLTWSLWAWFHPTEAGREAEMYRTKVAGEVSSVFQKHLADYKDGVAQLDQRIASRGTS